MEIYDILEDEAQNSLNDPVPAKPDIFEGLNDQQSQAIRAIDGPVLVLAGAGTGKTRVLISRIANIILSGKAQSHEILALTFTNKAANEMRERLVALLGDLSGIWLGTFHSICVRILRMYHQAAGLEENFVIIDEEEKNKIIKQVVTELGLDEKRYPVKLVAYVISSLKEKGINYQDHHKIQTLRYRDLDIIPCYTLYQERLKFYNLVDFDDLILSTMNMLKSNPDILDDLQDRFRYILVDEYQDTGSSQDLLLRLFAMKYHNICCVGDEDQSIYSWRGADVGNILNFSKNFPGAQIVRLEENYRSGQNILAIASAVISNNKSRYGKTLRANVEFDDKVQIIQVKDGRHEGALLCKLVHMLQDQKGVALKDMVILVRAAYQMQSIEDAMLKNGMSYNIVDGIKFYDRKEIKDLIAYLRIVYSDRDEPALIRAINIPKRGIGDKALSVIVGHSRSHRVNIMDSCNAVATAQEIGKKASESLKDFVGQVKAWRKMLHNGTSISSLMEAIVAQSGYMALLETEAQEDRSLKSKIENVKSFVASLVDFASMDEFLEHMALYNSKNSNQDENAISISTIHAAKGLEYKAVFLPGWEEGVFPSYRSIEDGGDASLEEERRLAYVAITRAKINLIIMYAKNRFVFGKWQDCVRSRFIKEIVDRSDKDSFVLRNLAGAIEDDVDDGYSDVKSGLRNGISGKSINDRSDFVKSLPVADHGGHGAISTMDQVHHAVFGFGKVLSLTGKYAEVLCSDGLKRLIHIDYLKRSK